MTKQKTAGQPKKFESGEELVELFREFCRYVEAGGFTILPTQSKFCDWLEDSYKPVAIRTIWISLNKYYPSVKSEYDRLLSDTLTQGAALGMYNVTMTIFCLKNWCNWKDKQETEHSGGVVVGVAEVDAQRALEELGYVKQ